MKTRVILAALMLSIVFVAVSGMTEEDYITVQVKQGDTLWAIAKKYLNDPNRWPEILKYNNIKDPNLIRPGMTIKIPKSLLKKQPGPAPTPGPSPTPTLTPTPTPTPGVIPTPGKTAQASVIHVAGEVLRIPPKGKSEPLKKDGNISSGDRLTTDFSSFATFALPAGATMMVGSETHVKFDLIEDAGGRLVLTLEQGMIRVKTGKQGPAVEINAGPTKVSGIDVSLQFRFEESVLRYLEVYSGKAVIASSGSSYTVAAGKGVSIMGNSMSQPKDLLDAPVLRAFTLQSPDGQRAGVMWSRPSDVSSYRLEVSEDEAFTRTMYIAGYAGNELDFAFFNQFPPGDYAFRLIAVSADGLWGKPSDAMVFQR